MSVEELESELEDINFAIENVDKTGERSQKILQKRKDEVSSKLAYFQEIMASEISVDDIMKSSGAKKTQAEVRRLIAEATEIEMKRLSVNGLLAAKIAKSNLRNDINAYKS